MTTRIVMPWGSEKDKARKIENKSSNGLFNEIIYLTKIMIKSVSLVSNFMLTLMIELYKISNFGMVFSSSLF